MVSRFSHILFFLGIFISSSGQAEWKTYTDEKGLFKIDFRGTPTKRTESQKFTFGEVVWTIIETNKPGDDNLSYSVKYADFPSIAITSDSITQLESFFFANQTDLVTTLGEAGLSEIRTKQVQKYPGREFRWLDKSKNVGYTRRMFLVGNRLYYLEVKFKLEDNFNKNILGFLDKFTLLNTPENPNPEAITEKPEKKFDVSFPGKTKVTETSMVNPVFDNMLVLSEAYETPKDQIDSPTIPNLLYGVNYAKLPENKLKQLSPEQLKEFVTTAFTNNTIKHSNSKILLQKEITIDGHWAFEGQVTVANGMGVMHLRGFIVKDYYYQVIVISKNGMQNNKAALDFLNSFKLIAK